jgi:prefoldin subunit 2
MSEKEVPIKQMEASQLDAAYQQADRERNMLITKLSELQQESREHVLVLEAFEKVEQTRRCFRLIGGVLVEQVVGEVKAPLNENLKRLQEYIAKLDLVLKEKTDRIQEIVQRSNKISKREADINSTREADRSSGSNDRGVLV